MGDRRTVSLRIGALVRGLGVASSLLMSMLLTGRAEAASSKTTTKPDTSKTASTKPAGVTSKTNVKVDVETKLAALQSQASPGLSVGKATCPPELAKVQSASKKDASKPVTYRCSVLVEGVPAPYDVEIRDGGYVKGGSFLISRAKAIIDIGKVVEGTKAQLDAKDRAAAKVSCGKSKVLIAQIGDTISCVVDYQNAAVGTQTIVYEVKDLDGTLALRL